MRVIDWDIAGWGPPAADVSVVAPEHYRQLTRDEWPYLSVGEIERFREVGRLLQAMLWIGQTASAAGASGGRAVRRLDQYRRIVMAAHAAVAR
jgi:thiamine kinase-like enzyme